ncbi:TAXI family TRAP transporter solute-binding subunit [Halomonas urumqiensis]|uniref:C4-dicarboxylate ABC transporter substrate-binding protein n=1 Tax=Halomonas urumqiensis TaxID=1684789 RepID=A0A2N7UH35_9GAMM|nr:TAXI family TRAP transporter solute-binding subunit [Halomonas urumqiensis]PMR79749.1 C4-dicarboxylate ABC transporter substrate-binding protein [Halomonas urumqiensis]PTB00952.1 C4-dicarboxylate ABC transporter substrate-binding protein [Halomonas urumqiensis]GHE23003.1 C4-dicarboxylate ABC transporter substrate-binding protein [Halomonas urumqiensis]
MKPTTGSLAMGLGVLLLLTAHASVAQQTLTIATASTAGVYHVAGKAICRVIDLPCEAEPSDGSSANLHALREGNIDMALAQSDLHYYAATGSEGFRDHGSDDSLRSVFSLHSEPFTLVVSRDSGIQGLDDLVQRSVNIGNPGSGQRGTMLRLMDARGWSRSSFRMVNDLPADQQSIELCHGNIDAMVYTVGHPNASVAQAIRLCNAALVDVQGEAIDALIQVYPFFSHAVIPGGLYGEEQPAVQTFGVRATLVASAQTDPDVVYRLVAGVFDNFTRFKASHPAFDTLTSASMIRDGLTAPLHEGALRYYREQGWMDEQPGVSEELSGQAMPDEVMPEEPAAIDRE